MSVGTIERLELLGLCERLGYRDELREEDFPVWHGEVVAEVACFAEPQRKDMVTAAMVLGSVNGDRAHARHIAAARALAAPVCVVLGEAQWKVFSIRAGQDPVVVHDGSSPHENPALARFLAPDVLAAAKRESQQLSLFDLDLALLDQARGAAGRVLDRRVRRAIAHLMPKNSTAEMATAAARTVVRALTALAVRDKLTTDRSLATALSRIEELTSSADASTPTATIINVADLLGQGLDFRTLDPALLGDVYERAILIPARRLSLGAYYTPPEIARRIVGALPVEEIDPSDRRVLDPSCGSGTLLLAANDRLQLAAPAENSDRGRHDYARERLFGSDNDPFAVELARLALFLQALPYGNGYRVECEDALIPRPGATTATVTVSNPPWGFARRDGKRVQRADAFLRRLLGRTDDGGFLACVLPVSWLTDVTSSESRAWLRANADVFEVWRLPTRTFRSSTMAPCVIFAHVVKKPASTYRFVSVWNDDRDKFRNDGLPSDTMVVASPRNAGGPFAGTWLEDLERFSPIVQLRDVATVRDGVPTSNIAALDSRGPHPFLPAYGAVAPFGRVALDHIVPCRYPEDFSRRGSGASPDVYLKPKVLVSAMSSVDEPWRLRAFMDPIGVIPRNSMYAVVPRQGVPMAALLGVLASAVASLWIAQRTATRMVNANTLSALPVPAAETWERVARAAQQVIQAQSAGAPLETVVAALDRVVFDAFSIPPQLQDRICAALAGRRAPEGVVRFPRRDPYPTRRAERAVPRAGVTLDVRADAVKIEVPGLTKPGGEWVAPPPMFPGWLARRGATFEVLVEGHSLDRAEFRYQEDAWMPLDALVSGFSPG